MAVAGGPQRTRRPARVVEGRAQLAEELELERADLVERLDGLRGAVARRGRRLGLRGAGELAIGPGQPQAGKGRPDAERLGRLDRRQPVELDQLDHRLLAAHAGAGLAGTTGTCRSAITAPVTPSIQGNGLDRAGS